jgi:hypothetical protein
MNYGDLIRRWHEKALDEDYFSKFTFEYLAFIAFLRTQKYPNSRNDRDALQQLKNDIFTKNQYFTSCSRRANNSYSKLKDEFSQNARLGNASSLRNVEEVKWWNHVCDADNFCRTPGCMEKPESIQEWQNGMQGVFYGENDWVNLIEFWATVRNNLFHGSKDPEHDRDKLVVEHGYKTLSTLVKILLGN